MQVFRKEESIYESGEKAKYPHQPRLDTKADFMDLDRAAKEDEDVQILHSSVKQPWVIGKTFLELKEEALATVFN